MPDGLTHILTGYICSHRWVRKGKLSLFLLGSVLPDILFRGGRLFLVGHSERDFMELYLTPLHTPIGTIFVCLALVQLFHRAFRMDAFKWLYGGCLGHFALDLLQATINGYGPTLEPLDGYHWLYPLSWFDFQIGVFWTEDTPWSLILLVPLSIWAYFGSLAHRSFLISQPWAEGVKVRERPKE